MAMTTEAPTGRGREHWEAVAQTWRRERPHALWRSHSDAVNSALLARWLPAGRVARVLKTDVFDEACSDGLYPLLAARADQVVGIDIAVAAQRAAAARHPGLRGVGADVRRVPIADGSVDVVVSTSTLDHFETEEDIAVALRELRRVLRPGGHLLLTLDNPVNPLIALRGALPLALWRRLGLVPYFVGATHGPRRLAALLSRLGFEVVEIGAVMHCPRVLAVALGRLLDRWGGPAARRGFPRLLIACERLEGWPTRFVTGHFVAVKAVKR